jgi:agmatine deiminase
VITRSEFLQGAAATLIGTDIEPLFTLPSGGAGTRIPDEGDEHECTWMAWAHSESIWEEFLPGVRRDLVKVANTIAQFEPVVMLALPSDVSNLKKLVSKEVEVMEADFNDLWIRDYGPQFVIEEKGRLRGVDLKFNGWGKKQAYSKDQRIAKTIAMELGIPVTVSSVVMEGGAVEVDGKGTLIATKSCIVNKNRNPGKSLKQIDQELKKQFGFKRIVWLEGVAGKDITDGHTDFYARFLPSGKVLANYDPDPSSYDHLVTKQHLAKLKAEFGASNVLTVSPPTQLPESADPATFAAGYINYYLVNGAVIAPKFGDEEADEQAKSTLESAYPNREVVLVSIDSIASGGGGIHCSTLHQPKAS